MYLLFLSSSCTKKGQTFDFALQIILIASSKVSFETNNSSSSQKFLSFPGPQKFINDQSALLGDDVATMGNRIPSFRHQIMSLTSRVEMLKTNGLQMP
jgi:hypothetical protein